MKRVYGAGVSLLMVLASAVAAQAEGDRREVLPDAILPLHYDVQLSPDATALSFRGKVAITVAVTASVNDITLNADGLTFDHASLDQTPLVLTPPDAKLGAGPCARQARWKWGSTFSRSTITADRPQHAGLLCHGLSERGGPRRTLATNFEPTGARKFLPCWDEPARKATFTISVDAPKDRMAVSNMPVDRSPASRRPSACVSSKRRKCPPICFPQHRAISSE